MKAIPSFKERVEGRINWGKLCENQDIRIIPILEQNLDKVCWFRLSANPNAIPILKKNKEKIKYEYLSMNTNPIDHHHYHQ